MRMRKWEYEVDIYGAIDRASDIEDFNEQKKVFEKAFDRAAARLPEPHADKFEEYGERISYVEDTDEIDEILEEMYNYADNHDIWTGGGRRDWTPGLGSLQDVPMPGNVERPEMWTSESVVQAVRDGFTFLLPFVSEGFWQPNAYWIKGTQAAANALTVGPEHTPGIELIDDDWIRASTFFQPGMVPEEAWLGPVNENGVVRVHIEIDPATIDWELLNRGHQIRIPKGTLGMAGKKKKKAKSKREKPPTYLDVHAWVSNSTDSSGPAWSMLEESLTDWFKKNSKDWIPGATKASVEDMMDRLRHGKAVLALTAPQVKELEETQEWIYEKHLDWGTDEEYARTQSNFLDWITDDPEELEVFELPRAK